MLVSGGVTEKRFISKNNFQICLQNIEVESAHMKDAEIRRAQNVNGAAGLEKPPQRLWPDRAGLSFIFQTGAYDGGSGGSFTSIHSRLSLLDL